MTSRFRTEERITERFALAFADLFGPHTAMPRDKIVALAGSAINQAREELRRTMQERADAYRGDAERVIRNQCTDFAALVESLRYMCDRWERNRSGDTTSHIAELHALIEKADHDNANAARPAASS